MVIGIVGLGVVGGALAQWFNKHTGHTLLKYDPDKGFNENIKHADATFICVPVPTNDDGTQDYSILESVLPLCGGKVFIRSTVLPGTNDKYGTYSCPEFLTERTAYQDTCEINIITGCKDIEFMKDVFPPKTITCMKNVEAEIAKYAHNCFGAMKVNFFNLIYNFCEMRGASYEKVLDGVLLSGHINKTHSAVPGPDGLFGYGGKCFTKDLKAFANIYPAKSLLACIEENTIHRGTSI